MAALKENKLPPSFSSLKSQKFLHECSQSWGSQVGTDNDEQSVNNSASSVFHLWLLEAFFWFKNSSIIYFLPSFHNRGWFRKLTLLIIVNRVIFTGWCKSILAQFQVLSWMSLKALVLKMIEFDKGCNLFCTWDHVITYTNKQSKLSMGFFPWFCP